MENDRLELMDRYSIDDTLKPVGVVIIKDADGNIIFKGNNMVVKTGRKMLFDLFTASSSTTFSDLTKFSDLHAFIGDNSNIVRADDIFLNGYQDITTNDDGPQQNIPSTSSGYSTDTLYYELSGDNDREIYIHMAMRYNHSGPAMAFSTFGLYAGSEGHEKLFSRIVFPTRTLTSETPILIDYYLYF